MKPSLVIPLTGVEKRMANRAYDIAYPWQPNARYPPLHVEVPTNETECYCAHSIERQHLNGICTVGACGCQQARPIQRSKEMSK